MLIHVFVGAGPANLHLAVKIATSEPESKIVFFDKRLKLISEALTFDARLENPRANIFFFDEEFIQKLIADGLNQRDMQTWAMARRLNRQGTLDNVPSLQYRQIQIQDIQHLCLKALASHCREKPQVISKALNADSFESLEEEVMAILAKSNYKWFNGPTPTIKIHVATGAFSDTKDSITYPPPTVTPSHGTATFSTLSSKSREYSNLALNKIELNQFEQLFEHTVFLRNWFLTLKQFKWTLPRPPSIRVFFAHDILYLGVEIPASMMALNEENYKKAINKYTRAIGRSIFPDLDMDSLPLESYSRFLTIRGENGRVLSMPHRTEKQIEIDDTTHTLAAEVQVFSHGDYRYRPHYQTASGFVVAASENWVYDDVYSRYSFDQLYTWAFNHHFINESKATIRGRYSKLLKSDANDKASEERLLKTFQAELYIACSRDLIEENKSKVDAYLFELDSAAIHNLPFSDISYLLETFNRHDPHYPFERHEFRTIPNWSIIFMHILKLNNIGFLRETLAQLMNVDVTLEDNQHLLLLRDRYLIHFQEVGSKLGIFPPSLESEQEMHSQCEIALKFHLQMTQLSDLSDAEFKEKKRNFINEFSSGKVIHQHTFFAPFSGKHSREIKNLVAAIKKETTPSKLATILKSYHDLLIDSKSKHTLKAFEGILSKAFPLTLNLNENDETSYRLAK